MIAQLLLDAGMFLGGGGAAILANYVRSSFHAPKPSPKPVADKSVTDMIKQGYEAVDKMARDIHALYHPPGCKCVYCELRADDKPPERTGVLCQNACFGCSVLTCDKHPDHAAEPNFVVMVDGQPVAARVSVEEPDREVSPDYVRALKQKLDGLRKENAELKSSREGRVITKTVERQSVLDDKIMQCAKFADDGQQPVKLDLEIQGRPIQVVVGPQREPDEKIVSFGGEVVRPVWHDKPASGPGSLGIMDRQLGTIGRICDRCNEGKAWKIVGDRHICKECFYTMPTNDVTSIRQEGGRKYVCYRDGHCEVT